MNRSKVIFNRYFFMTSIIFCAHQTLMTGDFKNRSKDKWGLAELFNETSVSMLKTLIKEIYPGLNPTLPVEVQTGTQLSKEEKRFLLRRMPIVQENLQKYFNITQPVRIGFCCSGGGNRAMVGTLGFLTGAAKTHLFDSALYVAGLSGSTWLISQLLFLSTTSHKNRSFVDILSEIKASYGTKLCDSSMFGIDGIYTPPLISFDSTDDVCIEIAKRFAYEQPMTLVNLFGALVGDYALGLMGNDRLSEKWSRIMFEVQKGGVPLPLCASIFEKSKSNYGWFEMSPLECGSAELGYIPVSYLGSSFYKGCLNEQHICPEYPISFYLGMYGSAFAVTIQDIANFQKALHRKITILKDQESDLIDDAAHRNILNNSFVQGLIQGTIQNLIETRNVLTYAQFPNFSKDLKTSVLSDCETLGLFDAGIAFDIPLPLLVDRPERNLDLIFLYGSFPGQKSVLQDLEKYCFYKKIPFPDISGTGHDDVAHNDMTVLNDPRSVEYDLSTPTYIYFPTNGIDLYAPPYITLNFRYTPEEIDRLSEKTEHAVVSHRDEIADILKALAAKRYA